jgi:hypothetical protein
MAESPKRASDSLAIPAPVLGPAAKKAKPSDNDDALDVPAVAARGEVVDLAFEDGSEDDSDASSDSASEEPSPDLPVTNQGRGVGPEFFVNYALTMQIACNRMSDVMVPLVRKSRGKLSADTRRKQREFLEKNREYLKALVVFTEAEIDIFDGYESE